MLGFLAVAVSTATAFADVSLPDVSIHSAAPGVARLTAETTGTGDVCANYAHDKSRSFRSVKDRYVTDGWVRIAAAASTAEARAAADFACTGTNDEVTIQKAIDLCKKNGKQLFLFCGLYRLGSRQHQLHASAEVVGHQLRGRADLGRRRIWRRFRDPQQCAQAGVRDLRTAELLSAVHVAGLRHGSEQAAHLHGSGETHLARHAGQHGEQPIREKQRAV